MTELIFKQECHPIVGCAMEVLNAVGHGFHEKIYENGLMVEFILQSILALQLVKLKTASGATIYGL